MNQGETAMPGKTERSLEELYQDDRERADAVAFGRRTGLDRRGFLGGTGLAAMGVAVGGSIPLCMKLVPLRHEFGLVEQ